MATQQCVVRVEAVGESQGIVGAPRAGQGVCKMDLKEVQEGARGRDGRYRQS